MLFLLVPEFAGPDPRAEVQRFERDQGRTVAVSSCTPWNGSKGQYDRYRCVVGGQPLCFRIFTNETKVVVEPLARELCGLR